MRDATDSTAAIEKAPDPKGLDLNAVWEAEWETNLLRTANDNLKRRIDPQHRQIFDFYANKEWPPEKVAERFGVSVVMVYQTKHRIIEQLRAEVARLEREMT